VRGCDTRRARGRGGSDTTKLLQQLGHRFRACLHDRRPEQRRHELNIESVIGANLGDRPWDCAGFTALVQCG
jgi:hypothetical protein